MRRNPKIEPLFPHLCGTQSRPSFITIKPVLQRYMGGWQNLQILQNPENGVTGRFDLKSTIITGQRCSESGEIEPISFSTGMCCKIGSL